MTRNKKALSQWLNMIESFHPDEIELGLERITQIANKLDLTEQAAKVIIVGGTNGKGSCVATLESLALNSELQVGCYTSPHLIKFNERIRVNGKDVSDQSLVDAFEVIDQARGKLALTFFEFTTLVALYIFKQVNLDLVVLEVGLGGRLDAVNIVEPDSTIITTIDLDHQSWLGDKLEDIAFEKSGICKQGICNFVGDQKSFDLILKARPEYSSELTLIKNRDLEVAGEPQLSDLIAIDSINPYRLLLQNVMLSTRAFRAIFPDEYLRLDLADVIKNINIRGRFQKLSENPMLILDVGHNVQAAKNLVNQIKDLKITQTGKRIAICGLMADKAIADFLTIMDEAIDIWYFVDLPIDRAAKSEQLESIFRQRNRSKHAYSIVSVEKAYLQIKNDIAKGDQLFVFGSFITVAEMLNCNL